MKTSLSLLHTTWNNISDNNIIAMSERTQQELKMVRRSLSFGEKDLEHFVLRSLSFKKKDIEVSNENRHTPRLENRHTPRLENEPIQIQTLVVLASPKQPMSNLDIAATKVQKVYKSYRTRRNLADCAVVVEELWWKALDYAELNRSSVSFFKINEHETPASRWVRARIKAAKVGKGLLKDEKAQKLALQHWLEAIDPRHRYGHNLHFYYDIWSESKSAQPFFYWLDVGDGKEINLEKKCSRFDLYRQCIEYLGPKEREAYQVIIVNGVLVYEQSRMLLNTQQDTKWIFVLSTSRNLYVGQKKKGVFQHSSFLSGGATSAAGRLVARDGTLEAIWPYSGHYHPTEDNFKEFIGFLEEHHVDLTNVKRCAVDDDTYSTKPVEPENANDMKLDGLTGEQEPKFNLAKRLSRKWTSGVGPRIGCVRDYPIELQSRAMEKVSLSPKNNLGGSLRNCMPMPIPSPRPSPRVRMSPRLAYMGLPSPRVIVSS